MLRELCRGGRIATDHAGQTGKNDAANNTIRKRFAEGDAGVETLRQILLELFLGQALIVSVSWLDIDAVDIEFRVLFEELQEFIAVAVNSFQCFWIDGAGCVVPDDLSVDVESQRLAILENKSASKDVL